MINSEKYIENIPPYLKDRSQWLWFKGMLNVDKHGMEKVIKISLSPITLKSNFWNQKENWADFKTAVNNMKCSGCDGLSFVLSKVDSFVCIDLDNVDNKKLYMFMRFSAISKGELIAK